MTTSTDQDTSQQTSAGLPAALADYADRLLLGTGLEATDAILIASGQRDAPDELSSLANALQAGWSAEDLA